MVTKNALFSKLKFFFNNLSFFAYLLNIILNVFNKIIRWGGYALALKHGFLALCQGELMIEALLIILATYIRYIIII